MKNGPYTLLVAPNIYPGKRYRNRYCYEHHLVWWVNTLSLVPSGFEIHHLNGNHRDNRFENLRLLTSKEHRDIHTALKRKQPIDRKCLICGIEYKCYKNRKKFCSRVCAGKHNQKKMIRGSTIGCAKSC